MAVIKEPVVSAFDQVLERLSHQSYRWLVTGGAGFIGSHLVESLLRLDQNVVTLDNLSTGHRANLEQVAHAVGNAAWRRHEFIEGDICDVEACRRACDGADLVLHQAALGSVPRSIADPITTNASNVTGFVNILAAAKDAGVQRFVYAASSSTYGDHPRLPKVEEEIGRPLSPYAVTKYVNELYAEVFARCYGIKTVGLRYFNVFGARQDPDGAYAAVIPRWIQAMLIKAPVVIYGDGETTRDFCFVANVVQANLLAAMSAAPETAGEVYNVAQGGSTSLNQLFEIIRSLLARRFNHVETIRPVYEDFRLGDVRHSRADISKAQRALGYRPSRDVREGLEQALPWYVDRMLSHDGASVALGA
jgi:UDP-N-acetylglucosamine 4-epimerase